MSGPLIAADQWPDTVVAKLWTSAGQCLDLGPFAGGWGLGVSSTPMPAGHDWRVPVMRPSGPVQMILHCPACALQHIDGPDERTPGWVNRPHKSHLCHGCGHIWRPADVATEGVVAIQTRGSADSAPASPQPASAIGLGQFRGVIQRSFERCHFGSDARLLRDLLALIDGQANCQTCGTAIKSHPLTGTICDCALQPTKGEGVGNG